MISPKFEVSGFPPPPETFYQRRPGKIISGGGLLKSPMLAQ